MPRIRLTNEQREQRRLARNEKRRQNYAEKKLLTLISRVPYQDRELFLAVLQVRTSLTGLLRAKAEHIVIMWQECAPKAGWREDAQEVIAA